jgi:hypothetical protein
MSKIDKVEFGSATACFIPVPEENNGDLHVVVEVVGSTVLGDEVRIAILPPSLPSPSLPL